MPEATLQRFLERLNEDASFRARAQADPESVLADFGLSTAEQDALSSDDQEALRRLVGDDVSGYFWFLASATRYVRTQSPTANVSEIGVTKPTDVSSTTLF